MKVIGNEVRLRKCIFQNLLGCQVFHLNLFLNRKMASNWACLTRNKLFITKYANKYYLKACLCSKIDRADKKPSKIQNETEVTKESLQWRTEWAERKNEWYSKFKVFSTDHNNTDAISLLQTRIDLRPSSIRNWLKNRRERVERFMQQYLPERNRILGNDLAAAHFLVHRGGSIKFYGEDDWVKQDENFSYDLPDKYVSSKIVQSIDCSNVNLYYEGLENFRDLEKLTWLRLNPGSNMDDWCIDRICGSLMRNSLKYLDIRNCDNITERGLGALYKMKKLETLMVNDLTKSNAWELTCLMLLELNPKLKIKTHE